MNFICRTIIALLIVFALKYLWIFYADKNIYNVTHINVCKTNTSTTGPNSSQDHYDTILLARFFTEDIVNEIYTNNIYEDLNKEIDKGTVTYLDYLMFYKSIYLGVILKRYSTSSCKCKIEDIQKFTEDTYNKNLRKFMKPEKEGRIIVRGDAFCEYRLQVQDFMWQIFINTCIVFPTFTIKPVTDKQNLLYANYVDGSIVVSYKTKKLYTLKFDMFSDNSEFSKDLAKHFESKIHKFGQNNYNHCLIDLTSLYVDLFSDFYHAFCRPANPKSKRKIMVDLRKSMNIYIIYSLDQVFETISKSANEHKQRNTVIFDIVTILEYLNINFSIPKESYSLIVDNLTSILEDIHITAREVWKNHGVKGSLESLEKHDFIYLKIFAHKNTNEFIGLLAMHLSKSDFAVVDQLTKKALLLGTPPLPRWIFEGTLVERIVNIYTTRSDLIKIYKKISQLIVDSCENHDETETEVCLECKLTKKLFGLICKNIDAYRKSLDHYIEYNYYQNMDEMIEFGFENTYRSGSESRAFSDVSKSDEDLPASPNSSIDLNTTNGLSNETTECFEVAKENENKTKQNKVVKVKKVHVSSKEKLMRQIQEEKERKMKQKN